MVLALVLWVLALLLRLVPGLVKLMLVVLIRLAPLFRVLVRQVTAARGLAVQHLVLLTLLQLVIVVMFTGMTPAV